MASSHEEADPPNDGGDVYGPEIRDGKERSRAREVADRLNGGQEAQQVQDKGCTEYGQAQEQGGDAELLETHESKKQGAPREGNLAIIHL
jgi:hypothetical protein